MYFQFMVHLQLKQDDFLRLFRTNLGIFASLRDLSEKKADCQANGSPASTPKSETKKMFSARVRAG